MKTNKQRAFWLALVAGLAGGLSYIAIIPPSEQDFIIGSIVNIFPVGWRGEIGAVCRLIAVVSGIYATTHASKAGPQTPPTNPPQ